MKREKVYRETIETLLEKKKMMKMGFCEQIGYTPSWFSKAFAKGYCDVTMPNIKLWAIVIGCTEEELTAIPVSPEGKAKERREKEAEAKQQTEYTIDDVVSEVQNLAAEMAAGFIEMRKDKASAQKQDDLYELIRNSVKMIHADIMTLLQAVRGEGQ